MKNRGLLPCLPLYGIVGWLVRFVQRQQPGWHRFRWAGSPVAEGRGERGGRPAGGRRGEPARGSQEAPNQATWRRRRSRIVSEPRTSERALPKEAGSISGTAEAAVALTVIMYGWAEDVFQAPPRLVR